MTLNRHPGNLTGYLVASGDDSELSLDHFRSCQALDYYEESPRYWEHFAYVADEELIGEQRLNEIQVLSVSTKGIDEARGYRYRLVCRRSGTKALLLGDSTRVVESFLRSNASAIGSGLVP